MNRTAAREEDLRQNPGGSERPSGGIGITGEEGFRFSASGHPGTVSVVQVALCGKCAKAFNGLARVTLWETVKRKYC